MNQLDLDGKRAVITGGARGMGFAIAQRLLDSGAAVTLWDINAGALARAETALAGRGPVGHDVVDVSDYASVEAGAQAAAGRMGGIDLLVNSAGIAGVNLPVTDYPLDTWAAVMNVNLTGIFHTCRALVPYMARADYGRIVNIASIAGKDGNPNASAYSVSKAGVIALTKSLGKELAQSGIRVNVVCPAVIRTEMLEDVTEEQIGYMLAKIPMGRMGTVEEIAAMVGWMCSAECSYTTGAVFDLSGGRATY
ncbi:SDR family NAD(P)-dependent oxidoreductase [Pseudoponticoccus marisrubri]|uniref:3-oxoacyl-ACP reductase n=1 Tax=Pseudoponticoccus marisrubri TaxID=1685382 RepID=A0A0W7WHB0_9RHOB|nr:SDR family NAD(P)-dependent oxidoreductase [Pseudoponticoccus marisrubri]KUF09870.1 3-oxoacyl-ACP reductase [Pseudoponticoccus marisrubri]